MNKQEFVNPSYYSEPGGRIATALQRIELTIVGSQLTALDESMLIQDLKLLAELIHRAADPKNRIREVK